MKLNLLNAVVIACLGCLVVSCDKTGNSLESDRLLDTNLLRSAKMYQSLMDGRDARTASFTIEDIERNGSVLSISVKGGCREEEFKVVWDGSITLSHPGQVNLILDNDGNNNCGLESWFKIKINLRKIVKEHNPEYLIFNVANGSMKQDKSLNPDGSVSSN